MRGNAARTISSLLSAVENEVHVHILHNKHVELAVIELPRLKLDFHVASGDDQIRSRQYRGMVLDEDQNLGTMVGLNSKLVLRQSQSASDRLVLIPEGFVQFSRTSTHHVSVLIRRQGDAVIHAYRLDTTLGRVLDSGALQSKLLLSYLHALTSHCLPDPLTRSTGTEAAVTILRSSAVRSFTGLTLYNMKVLNKKASLSPSRSFYPPNERVMQQIGGNSNQSPLSQHDEFHVLFKEIFNHEKTMSLFRSSDAFAELPLNDMKSIDPGLHERAVVRSSTFQIAGFGAEDFGTDVDNFTARETDNQTLNKGDELTWPLLGSFESTL